MLKMDYLYLRSQKLPRENKMNDEVYFELNIEELEKLKKKAIAEADENCDKGDEGKRMLFNNLTLESSPSERYFDKKKATFTFSGNLQDKDSEENLGYLSFDVDMDADTLLEIIQVYMKKLGKVKTVLEAVKDE